MAKLPNHRQDDVAFVQQMAQKYRIAVIPGSAAGLPGYIRLSFANTPPEIFAEALDRLDKGLEAFCSGTSQR